ncbi:hypothetical protein EDB87DRAFT_131549 [Lactarius vividus]|nr:hypothetical protein EDB87DRAFT_131549 [Lactarius vividus]
MFVWWLRPEGGSLSAKRTHSIHSAEVSCVCALHATRHWGAHLQQFPSLSCSYFGVALDFTRYCVEGSSALCALFSLFLLSVLHGNTRSHHARRCGPRHAYFESYNLSLLSTRDFWNSIFSLRLFVPIHPYIHWHCRHPTQFLLPRSFFRPWALAEGFDLARNIIRFVVDADFLALSFWRT